MLRVFHDRLVDDQDRAWTCNLIMAKIEEHFRHKPKQASLPPTCLGNAPKAPSPPHHAHGGRLAGRGGALAVNAGPCAPCP